MRIKSKEKLARGKFAIGVADLPTLESHKPGGFSKKP